MTERGSGTILFTGGGFALEPHPEYLSLSIGKAGIRALAHGLRARGRWRLSTQHEPPSRQHLTVDLTHRPRRSHGEFDPRRTWAAVENS
jgi:hypothetical protein